MSSEKSKPESAVFERAKEPLMPQGLEKEDKQNINTIEPTVNANKDNLNLNLNLNENKNKDIRENTNASGDALSNANVPMINDFAATTTTTTTSSGKEIKNENKSLFAKAKDTLSYIKDTAMQMTSDLLKKTYKYSNPNEAPITGMGKLEFEATRLKLEKNLHLNGMMLNKKKEEKQSLNKQFDQLSLQEQEQLQQLQQPQQQQPLFDTNNQFTSSTFDQSGITSNQPISAVQGSYQEVNKEEFVKAPDAVFQPPLINDNKKDELAYLNKDKNEIHTLPSIKVQDKPVIIEKEVEYEKPVEIKQTIVHQEKPIIVEQPIIKQKFEHYRDNTQFESNQQKFITETTNNNNVNENDTLLNLRKDRIDTFNDTKPIIQQQKEKIQLDTEYREQPTVVNEKQVIYQQPVEIEQKFVEKIKPVVREDVTLQKEHVYEKQAPQVFTDNVQQIQQNDQFFSKDTNTTTGVTGVSNLDARNDANYVAGQEVRTSK